MTLGQVFGIAYRLRNKPWCYDRCQHHTPRRNPPGSQEEGQRCFDLIQDPLIQLVFELEDGRADPRQNSIDSLTLAMLSNRHAFADGAVAIAPGHPEWPQRAQTLAARFLKDKTIVPVSFQHGPKD